MFPQCDTSEGDSLDTFLPPNLVQGGPRGELEHDGLDSAVIPECSHDGQLEAGGMLIWGGKAAFWVW